MEKYLIYVLLIFTMSCGSKPKKTGESVSDIQSFQYSEDTQHEKLSIDPKPQISDTDLRIASALAESIKSEKPWLLLEQYDAYYNNKELYVKIIEELSTSEDSIRSTLDINLNRVIVFVRETVAYEYQEFNSLEGRYFSFLYMVKDSSVNHLLIDIENNPRADSIEIEKIKRIYPLIESSQN